ncbi:MULTISPECIES: hypothetical protein [unclassified Pseudoalteromonas]|uniref:hypothetical protein n=1 Tax=unclassified Pseudoalteromonas TaxID=194690 RepID=UPI0005AAD766|nr:MULTISPECIES: hypothetical protein [unclassified Pseudoalteromonas]
MRKISFTKRVTDAASFRTGQLCHIAKDVYYKQKNKSKPKLLVFTDSRGYEVVKPWNRKSAYASYVGLLCQEYDVDYVICPEFSTTVIDFVYEYQKRITSGQHYDAVIAHVGVVDFSPRPTSMLDDMMAAKSHKIEYIFDNGRKLISDFKAYHDDSFDDLYFGKTVKNFYPKGFLKDSIIPQLKNIPNLIMVGCSPVLSDWRGNYWRERPNNMNMILEYSNICKQSLNTFIDLSTWSSEEIKLNTIDNIHLSQQGFNHVHKLLKAELDKLLLNRG